MTAFDDAAREMAELTRRVEQLESQLRTLRQRHDEPERTSYKVAEAAALLNVHPQTVRNMIADGRLPAEDMGGWYVIDASVVAARISGRSA